MLTRLQFIFLIAAFTSFSFSELNLKLLSKRPELWPKEVILLQTISYNQSKKFRLGSKLTIKEITADEIVFKEGNSHYRLGEEFTNLSFLVDENALLQAPSTPTATATQNPTTNPHALEGPDFSFLLNTKTELTDADKNKAIDLLVSEGGYLKLSFQLNEALYKGIEAGETTSPAWTDRVLFSRICSILGKNEISLSKENSLFSNNGETPLYKRFKPETLRFFLSSPPALTKALLVIKETDHIIGLFSILENLFEIDPDHLTQYSSLAGALAIVYDQPIPPHWPHYQVKKSQVPQLNEKPWIPLFLYFQKKDQENVLSTKLKEMSVSELKYVIDAPLDLSEFEWALKNERQGRGSFDKAYFDVDYDEARIRGSVAQYNWPHEAAYTLANIKKLKGICIDQSYFSSIAAKAFGIPSISISGQGSNCAHAWLGFMPSGDKWNMKGGRYEANNYVVGFALDPQTWTDINDHELEYISQRYSDSPEYYQSQTALVLLNAAEGSFSDSQVNTILQESKTNCPKNPEPWFKLEKHYKKTGQNEELKALYTQMTEQFSLQKDWKTLAQEGLAKLASINEGDTSTSSEINAKIIRENRGKRADLAIDVATREALLKLQNENYDEAFEAYQNVIRKFGKENGLLILKSTVSPFIAIAIAKQQQELIPKALKAAEKLIDNSERQASLNQTKQALDELKKEATEK